MIYRRHDDNRAHLFMSYALSFFVLGVMVGLLAVVGRIALEVQDSFLNSLRVFSRAGMSISPTQSSLPPLIKGLGSPGGWLIATGFAISVAAMSLGALIWRVGGFPSTTRERVWTQLGALIEALLVISMGFTTFSADSSARLVMLVVPSALALLAYIALVFGIARYMLYGDSVDWKG